MITAVIPCYNGGATLRAAIQSVLNQSVRVGELLVIDDGSTDDSAAIAQAAGARVVAHEQNRGRGAARKTAVEAARGEFVLFCDAAIALGQNFIEIGVERMREGRVAAVFGCPRGDAGSAAHRWRERHLFKAQENSAGDRNALLATGGALCRRSAILEAGNFNPERRSGEDSELGRRLLEAGYNVVFEPSLSLRCLRHDNVRSVLQRYARWNAQGRLSAREYLRQVSYAIKVMAAEDLRQRDLPCAAISLLCPHALFWMKPPRANA